jgi:cytochrome c oxidase assembly factor CtaG
MLASSLAVLLGVYAAGVARLWRAAGCGRGVRRFEALAFGCGWLALVAALSPPLDEWSDRWLSAHMIQHELLMVIAAPLIAMSAPAVALLWALPSLARRRAVESGLRRSLTSAWTTVTSPLSAFLLHGLALWVWHLPALYDSALEHEAVHALQHICFFGTAALFWWGIIHGRYGRIGYGVAVMYVFATAVHGGVLGALLTFSPRVWYTPYVAHHPPGLTPLEDQQLAGLLMWVPAGLIFVAGGLALFAAWLRQSDRLSRLTLEQGGGGGFRSNPGAQPERSQMNLPIGQPRLSRPCGTARHSLRPAVAARDRQPFSAATGRARDVRGDSPRR